MKRSSVEQASGDHAASLVKAWLPDEPIRRQCLELLAGSIAHVRRIAPERWGVTLCPNGEEAIRLTVGMIYVCNLSPGGIALTLHGPSQRANDLTNYLRADNLADLDWCAAGGSEPRPNAPRFPSAPEAVWCWFNASDISAVWPLVRDAYIRLIDVAAERKLNPSVLRTHSLEVMDYLRVLFPDDWPVL